MIKRIITLLTFSLLITIMLSCGGKTSKNDGITVNVGPEPQTIDPTLNSSIDGAIYINHIFEGLARRDKEGKIAPGVAERWDITPDGLEYTFYIRSNAKWADGKPVTAQDFVYSWRRAVDPITAASYSYQMDPLENAAAITKGEKSLDTLGVKAIDEKTLYVKLKAPTPYFLELMAYAVYFPLREDVVSTNADNWTRNTATYIGNGPYKMTERKIDDKIVFEKSPEYWDIASMVPEKITFILMDNDAAVLAGIKEGSLMFANRVAPKDIPNLQKEGILVIKPYMGTYYYAVNFTNATLKDSRIRRALALAIDRNYLVEQVTKGGQIPATAWVCPGITDSDGGDFRKNGGDYYSVKPEDFEKNVAEAKKLLADAGYADGKGLPVIEFKTNPGAHTEIFEAVQQMWKQNLGIDSIISQEEWAVFQQTRQDKNFAVARHGWIGDYDDPMTFLGLFQSFSTENNGGYNNPEFDRLIKLATTTVDKYKRMEILHNAEKILMTDMGLIPIYFYTLPLLQNPKLKGVQYDFLGKHKFFYTYMEE